MLDYPGNHDAWSDSKKAKYMENIVDFLYDPRKVDIHNSFQLMVKTGEEYVTLGERNYEYSRLTNRKDRPRAVMSPNKSGCGAM